MSLCDSCVYQYNVEQLKPCIVRKDDCEFYKKEGCDTCEHSDEIDGNNCYECVKDMRNNYSPKKTAHCKDCK